MSQQFGLFGEVGVDGGLGLGVEKTLEPTNDDESDSLGGKLAEDDVAAVDVELLTFKNEVLVDLLLKNKKN